MANLESHKEFIPINSLPQTFQDALLFTHRLGMDYLWVDCLCIIQDSTEDWMFEASQMAAVYSQSLLTLHAMTAEDSEGGLFAALSKEYTTISVPQAEGILWYSVRQKPEHLLFKGGVDPVQYKIMTRGWCYQEQMLSPRSLYFTSKGLNWECLTGSWCECHGPMIVDHELHSIKSPSVDDDGDLEGRYNKAAAHYALLSLTNTLDKLPAFAGIARAFRNHHPRTFRGKYLAGLWQSQLPEHLFWMLQDYPTPGSILPRPWRAPSWSWAATDAMIEFSNRQVLRQRKLNIQIVETHHQLAGPDEFGQVLSAHLIIRAKLVPAKIAVHGSYILTITASPTKSGSDLLEYTPDYDLFALGSGCISVPQDVYIMSLVTLEDYKEVLQKDQWPVPFLVLVKIIDAEGTHYLRIGCGRYDQYSIWQGEQMHWRLLENECIDSVFMFK
jgi:hypothetical protein